MTYAGGAAVTVDADFIDGQRQVAGLERLIARLVALLAHRLCEPVPPPLRLDHRLEVSRGPPPDDRHAAARAAA